MPQLIFGLMLWAISNTYNTDNRTIQFEQNTGAFYVDAPVGVFRFNGQSPTTWTKIK
jgi:hypothetical protein